jgi:hypothetical protein
MSDYYYDDPQPELSPRSKPKLSLAFLLILVLAVTYFQTTLAANISLNTGAPNEFGQGVSVTTACSGGNVITIKPGQSLINSSGAGAFYISSITVSGIPSSCNGKDFNLSVYDSSTGSTPLPMFTGISSAISAAVIYSDGGNFKEGYQTAGTTITSGSGTFTVSFDTPLALASRAKAFTLVSTEHAKWDCSIGAPCSIGQTGPGGGVVFFVSTGFTCGPTLANTCRFLEVAPNGWNGGDDPTARWSVSAHAYDQVIGTGGMIQDGYSFGLTNIGRGYLNSLAIVAQGNDNTTAAGLARSYAGGGKNDWYLPNLAELHQLCQWNTGQSRSLGTTCNGGYINNSQYAGASTSGFSASAPYWSSSEHMYLNGFYLKFDDAASYGDTKTRQYLVRPIRAF